MLRTYPDPILGAKSLEVSDTDNWQEPLDEMLALMEEHKALGVAAIQTGSPLRMFVMKDGRGHTVVINPQILVFSKEKTTESEGCLSVPGALVLIKRPERIFVSFRSTPSGVPRKVWFKGQDARVFQHEFDHLNGKLITER